MPASVPASNTRRIENCRSSGAQNTISLSLRRMLRWKLMPQVLHVAGAVSAGT